MNWSEIISTSRTGVVTHEGGVRTEYQRDFDRIIFSSGFRRLQNKTQVFPLPGSTFVHNRLTHSLEVASVGRSIGSIVGRRIATENELSEDIKTFYQYELSAVIASACLAHDIGNPAFGHSGEKAISNYFIEYENEDIEGKKLKQYFSEQEWKDLTNFEGNANAFRILTNQFKGKSTGGLRLTYTTLASLLKYPCESIAMKKGEKHRSKYGFFQTENETAKKIFEELNMIKESDSPLIYKRHPFVYLTEAADDICYRIIDYEDAHRLGILSSDEVEKDFISLIECINRQDDKIEWVHSTLAKIEDKNERISYLRAKSINVLALEASDIFHRNIPAILEGTYNNSLIDELEENCSALERIRKVSEEKIYNHKTVIEIEIAGYNVMSELLYLLIPPILKANPNAKDKKVLRLIPKQFEPSAEGKSYDKVLSVLDFVSGMTDPFATELYRKVSGIDIPKHN
jgi:dGTPase